VIYFPDNSKAGRNLAAGPCSFSGGCSAVEVLVVVAIRIMTRRSANGRHANVGGISMRRLCTLLTAVLLLCVTAGCGSDKEKGAEPR